MKEQVKQSQADGCLREEVLREVAWRGGGEDSFGADKFNLKRDL